MTDVSVARPTLELGTSHAEEGVRRTIVTSTKPNGQRIAGLLAAPADAEPRGCVVISPGFGRTMRHGVALALPFVRHGYATLRYDMTNHAGDSDGDMWWATLSSAADDLTTMAAAIRSSGWEGSVHGVAASISGRAVTRAAAEGAAVDGLALLLPVVDLAATVLAVTGEDLVADYRAGLIGIDEPVEILGQKLSGRFFDDAVSGGYDTLDSARADLAATPVAVAALAAEQDEWVRPEDVMAAMGEATAARRTYLLETASHDSYTLAFMRTVGQVLVGAVCDMRADDEPVANHLNLHDLMRAVRIEKDLLAAARGKRADDRHDDGHVAFERD